MHAKLHCFFFVRISDAQSFCLDLFASTSVVRGIALVPVGLLFIHKRDIFVLLSHRPVLRTSPERGHVTLLFVANRAKHAKYAQALDVFISLDSALRTKPFLLAPFCPLNGHE